MQKPGPTAAIVAVIAALIIIMVVGAIYAWATQGARPRDSFWTRYGGASPPGEQVRRFDAAEKGVPDMPWAEAYWPPNYCGAVPPPVRGEPARPPYRTP